MSGRLQLRRGVVVREDPLTVDVGGEPRPAWADTALLGEMREGDEVVVNVCAVELGLGSGGFDVVHVNLTRGLDLGDAPAGDGAGAHVVKLNYTSLQHPVAPVEESALPAPAEARRFSRAYRDKIAAPPVLVLPLHGHLAPAAWASRRRAPDLALGYVQTGGGALPGALSRDVAELRERGLLAGHVTVAPAYGGEREAISASGALAAAGALGWDAVLIGPGPGIIGSDSELGHGGMAALDSAHAALALGMTTAISPRLSSSDPRERHRSLSHHSRTVLESLLAPLDVVAPAEIGSFPGGEEAEAELRDALGDRHRAHAEEAELGAYGESGLPRRTMGRDLEEDPLFFAAPLGAGAWLAGAVLRGKV